MANPDDDRASPHVEDPQRLNPQERRRRFAAAITKAEFGRFYWDDELERRLRSALERPGGKPGGRRKSPEAG